MSIIIEEKTLQHCEFSSYTSLLWFYNGHKYVWWLVYLQVALRHITNSHVPSTNLILLESHNLTLFASQFSTITVVPLWVIGIRFKFTTSAACSSRVHVVNSKVLIWDKWSGQLRIYFMKMNVLISMRSSISHNTQLQK